MPDPKLQNFENFKFPSESFFQHAEHRNQQSGNHKDEKRQARTEDNENREPRKHRKHDQGLKTFTYYFAQYS